LVFPRQADVEVVRTERAGHFFKPEDIPDIKIHTDEMEWKVGGRSGCAKT